MVNKQNITLLLLVSILASVSCGQTAKTDSISTVGISTDTDSISSELAPDLPKADFNGTDFTFLNGNTAEWMTTFVVTAEQENGETINDAIYQRNINVEEKYNVKIKEISTTSVRSDVSKAVTSGDNSFDVALMVSADAQTNTLEGAATDYADIPYVDVTNPWWIPGSVSDFSIMNHVYYAISEFDTTHYDGVRTLFFNKELADKYNLESPYQLIYDGKWTLDKFLELGMAVAFDINGDSEWGEGDRYGFTSYDGIAGQTLMTSTGVFPSLGKDSNDMLVFDMNNETNITKLIKIGNIFNDYDGFLNPNGSSANNGGVADFKDGRVLFYNETLGNINKLRDMTDDFGIIPAPKYDESQEKYYSLGGNPYFMIVPVTSSELEKTGILMEALAYESIGIIDTAFYKTFLQDKLARDEDSTAMLDIIFNNLTYFHPVARDYVCTNITSLIWSGDENFASYFAQNESTIQGLIDTAIAKYNENVDK